MCVWDYIENGIFAKLNRENNKSRNIRASRDNIKYTIYISHLPLIIFTFYSILLL